MAGSARLLTSSGQVVSVDAKAKAMVVNFENSPGRTAVIPFDVDRHTKVTRDVVRVTFETVNGKIVAPNVGIEPKPAT